MISTTPQLLAASLGVSLNDGEHRCFYCGAACDDSFASSVYVAKSFNDRAIVSNPHSQFVCVGCTLAMREHMTIEGKDKPQRMRTYSWLISRAGAVRMAKGEYGAFESAVLEPPAPPWALAIAVSGQKHLLYRTPVNFGGDVHSVLLETDRVDYDIPSLRERLSMAKQLAAAVGKIALSERLESGHYIAIDKMLGDDGLVLAEEWSACRDEPLSRLACFLCPGKEQCLEYLNSPAA